MENERDDYQEVHYLCASVPVAWGCGMMALVDGGTCDVPMSDRMFMHLVDIRHVFEGLEQARRLRVSILCGSWRGPGDMWHDLV